MPKVLSDNQIREYEQDGVVFPLKVLSEEEAAQARVALETLRTALGEQAHYQRFRNLHLFHSWARELTIHPRILDAVEDIIGPDILVHGTGLFWKPPRDPAYVSWHQDGFNAKLSELRYVTAWVALTDSSTDNGCMRVVRGSHHDGIVSHDFTSVSPDNIGTGGLEIARHVEESEATDITLAAGEMSLHHAAIVHGSNPNNSDRSRIGYAVRYAAPSVRQKLDHQPVILARGHDRFGHFRLLEEPPSLSLQEAIEAQQELMNWVGVRTIDNPVPLPASTRLRWREAGSPAA
jgi:ectoine hydroxylase-related dioxygenase (phytanoyl-CoA dioxygenase family)